MLAVDGGARVVDAVENVQIAHNDRWHIGECLRVTRDATWPNGARIDVERFTGEEAA